MSQLTQTQECENFHEAFDVRQYSRPLMRACMVLRRLELPHCYQSIAHYHYRSRHLP